MDDITARFYLSGRYAGECVIPWFPMKPGDRPLSHHYIDPDTGETWASVEVRGARWSTYVIPSLANACLDDKRWPRGLRLDWLFGRGFYNKPDLLALLPPQVLAHEFRAHCYNYDLELTL
jgi:hypothetical protein